jgi:hypothetical protein
MATDGDDENSELRFDSIASAWDDFRDRVLKAEGRVFSKRQMHLLQSVFLAGASAMGCLFEAEMDAFHDKFREELRAITVPPENNDQQH